MTIAAPIRKQTEELTYDDYLRLPTIEQPYEIIDGVLIMSPCADQLSSVDFR